jgi:hypothetical protein
MLPSDSLCHCKRGYFTQVGNFGAKMRFDSADPVAYARRLQRWDVGILLV